ncbi:MAG: hypothetical protein OJF51_003112 [Nitrospira sp.]|nr:MAG: hypothetical protein OJF51_003112 [Nitrospira sp.]
MQSKRPLSCHWCSKRRFLRIRSGAQVLFSLRLRARKRCVGPASSRIIVHHYGSWSPLRAARSARRKKF